MDTALDWVSLGISIFLAVALLLLSFSRLRTNRITFYTRLFDIYTQVFKDRLNELEERLKNPKSRMEREETLKQIKYNENTLKLVQSMLIGNLKPGKIFTNKIAEEITAKMLKEKDPVVQLYFKPPK